MYASDIHDNITFNFNIAEILIAMLIGNFCVLKNHINIMSVRPLSVTDKWGKAGA